MDGDFFKQVDPTSREAQEALKALLGTTLAQLNEIDKNVVGSSSNIRGVKTDLKNVLQNIATAPAPQPRPSPQPHHITAPVVHQVVQQPEIRPAVVTENLGPKLDKILEKLEEIKQALLK